MEEAIGVPQTRGLIRFTSIAEENLATNGKTVLGDIQDLEKETGEESSSLRRSLSRSTSKAQKRSSMRNLRPSSRMTSLAEQGGQVPIPKMPPTPTDKSYLDVKAANVQKISRRKSFLAAVFGTKLD